MSIDPSEYAIIYRNVYKTYDSNMVLKGLSITVPRGAVYGLLGPSGCGKTTLLSSIVGLISFDSGYMQVNASSTKEIGYMPQENCLNEQLTIKENIFFYGYLYGMKSLEIYMELMELAKVLELHPLDRNFGNLSGGQQKRVSMAATFIHNPQILILDEPTVGLDPILIDKLWIYFKELTKRGKTIIITTHYIQEAHQADVIGMIRNGVVLVEKTPDEIIQENECDNLEEAFLKLSQKQQDILAKTKTSRIPAKNPVKIQFNGNLSMLYDKYKALTYKNVLLLKRDLIFTLFILLLPGVTTVIANLCVGSEIKDLKLGIINNEIPKNDDCSNYNFSQSCFLDSFKPAYYSCVFIDQMKNKSIELKEYDDIRKARKDLSKNKIKGLLEIPNNYSDHLKLKWEVGLSVKNSTLDNSSFHFSVNPFEPFIESILMYQLIWAMNDFLNQTMSHCGIESRVAKVPLIFEQPIFGKENDLSISHTLNCIIVLSSFFYPGFMSLVYIYTEKAGGVTDRIMATGISRANIIIALMMFLVLIAAVECLEMMFITYTLFDFPCDGNLITAATLLMVNSVAGLFLGFLLAVMFKDLMIASFTGSGLLLGLIFITGGLWPIEAHEEILKNNKWAIPVLQTVNSLKDVNSKGSSFDDDNLIKCYLNNLQWIGIFSVAIFLCMKFKK